MEEGTGIWFQAICLHPITVFAYGIQEIGRLEDAGVGVTWYSFSTTDNSSGFTIMRAITMLMMDSFLGTVASWYLNRVTGTTDSVSFSFLFHRSYWFPRSRGWSIIATDEDHSLYLTPSGETAADTSIPLEPVSEALRQQAEEGASIEIHNLRKVFLNSNNDNQAATGIIAAVDGLNLSMYRGQVTALLGHNGKPSISRMECPVSNTFQLTPSSFSPTCFVVFRCRVRC